MKPKSNPEVKSFIIKEYDLTLHLHNFKHRYGMIKYYFFLFGLILAFHSCKEKKELAAAKSTTLDSAALHSAYHALDGLVAFDSLEIQLFASEPMIQNPTNIDVDARGRVYVCEAYNYRPQISGVSTKFEGDRIMILEDVNGDGKADSAKVFYQGPEVNAPLGICVMGKDVLVSQSPYIWKLSDTNYDDKADVKTILFQGIQGIQDDHGVHALTLGPDGRYYFTMGNSSKTLNGKDNRPIKTINGKTIDADHFNQGLTLRGNLDGTGFEVLGQNFRNNYECALDSYGNIWQSDNDDDGNRGTRINYILEYGNYGYKDELTGASWPAYRANWEDSIPLRHWHLNDPGVVPNLLQTGSGSPAGMAVYEGDLIPRLKGKLIHAEPLHHVIRAYTISNLGAGKTGEIQELVKNTSDSWFRPVDVAVAPDGSVMIADWYDPGVGGHYAGDQLKGRIYRLAPRNSKYINPVQSPVDIGSSIEALKSPNLSTRSQAQVFLRSQGLKSIPFLKPLLSDTNPIFKARALWILADLDPNYIDTALVDPNEEIKLAGLRMARKQNPAIALKAIEQLLSQENNSAQIWRECAIALKNVEPSKLAGLWLRLAEKYKNSDRWLLEALGIAADQHWDVILPLWLANKSDPTKSQTDRDILWRSRSPLSLGFLKRLASDNNIPVRDRLRYFRAFDFISSPSKNKFLLEIFQDQKDSLITDLIIRSLEPKEISKNPKALLAVNNHLDQITGTAYLDLIEKFYPINQMNRLSSVLRDSIKGNEGTRAARALIKMGGWSAIEKLIKQADSTQLKQIITGLGGIGTKESIAVIEAVATDNNRPASIRGRAYRSLGKSWIGEEYVLNLLAQDKIPHEFIQEAIDGPVHAWRQPIRKKALEYSAASSASTSYSLTQILPLSGNPENGKKTFQTWCMSCHQIGNEGIAFGPSLDDIGSKYGKDALFVSITDPSKSINFSYEGLQLITQNGGIIVGIKQSETKDAIVMKSVGGQLESVDKKLIKERILLKQSLMTPNLYQNMKEQELADLLEFLSIQKKSI